MRVWNLCDVSSPVQDFGQSSGTCIDSVHVHTIPLTLLLSFRVGV